MIHRHAIVGRKSGKRGDKPQGEQADRTHETHDGLPVLSDEGIVPIGSENINKRRSPERAMMN